MKNENILTKQQVANMILYCMSSIADEYNIADLLKAVNKQHIKVYGSPAFNKSDKLDIPALTGNWPGAANLLSTSIFSCIMDVMQDEMAKERRYCMRHVFQRHLLAIWLVILFGASALIYIMESV